MSDGPENVSRNVADPITAAIKKDACRMRLVMIAVRVAVSVLLFGISTHILLTSGDNGIEQYVTTGLPWVWKVHGWDGVDGSEFANYYPVHKYADVAAAAFLVLGFNIGWSLLIWHLTKEVRKTIRESMVLK